MLSGLASRTRWIAANSWIALLLWQAAPALAGTVRVNGFAPDPSFGGLTAGPNGALWATFIENPDTCPTTGLTLFPDPFPDCPTPGVAEITPDGGLTRYYNNGGGAITTGADGNLWITSAGSLLERMTPSGTMTTFDLADNSEPGPIVSGPDQNLWFLDSNPPTDPAGTVLPATARGIGRLTLSGVQGPAPILGQNKGTAPITVFPIALDGALGPGAQWRGLTAGPKGNFWAAACAASGTPCALAEISTAGSLLALVKVGGGVGGVATGADGNVWFTESHGIGRLDPTTAKVTRFRLNRAYYTQPTAITAGPDGNVWFLDNNALERIDPAGRITLFNAGADNLLLASSGGRLWFTTAPQGLFGDDHDIASLTPPARMCRTPNLHGATLAAAPRLSAHSGCALGLVIGARAGCSAAAEHVTTQDPAAHTVEPGLTPIEVGVRCTAPKVRPVTFPFF